MTLDIFFYAVFKPRTPRMPRLAGVPEMANIPWVSFEGGKKRQPERHYIRKKGMNQGKLRRKRAKAQNKRQE